MNFELKDRLKPPFKVEQINELVFISDNSEWNVLYIKHSKKLTKDIVDEFTAQAMNEKWERDFGEPMRWIAVPKEERDYADYAYDCPKCKNRQYFYEGEMAGHDYCPYCGQRLDPPEEE